MFKISGPASFRLLMLLWPALLIVLLYIFPGQDGQRVLERRLRGQQAAAESPPVPGAAAVGRPSRQRGRGGVQMFWEEQSPGHFKGEIYIPPAELQGQPAGPPDLQENKAAGSASEPGSRVSPDGTGS